MVKSKSLCPRYCRVTRVTDSIFTRVIAVTLTKNITTFHPQTCGNQCHLKLPDTIRHQMAILVPTCLGVEGGQFRQLMLVVFWYFLYLYPYKIYDGS